MSGELQTKMRASACSLRQQSLSRGNSINVARAFRLMATDYDAIADKLDEFEAEIARANTFQDKCREVLGAALEAPAALDDLLKQRIKALLG
jgi:hypothetical protein